MQSTLIDNSEHLKLVNTLKELIKLSDITHIDIATGYWDILGTRLITEELRAFLERSPDTHVRLLIGKDPYLFAQYNADPKYKGAEYPQDFIRTDLADLKVKEEYIPAVRLLLDFCKEQHEGQKDPKIEIRIFRGMGDDSRQQFFHSKCYIFYGEGKAFGIIGSSNFTGKGLQENSELNYLETVPQIITAKPDGINRSKGHISWFNEKWALASDWTKAFLEEVLKPSALGEKAAFLSKSGTENFIMLSPDEIYIKFLIDQFAEVVDLDGKITSNDYMPHDPDFKKLIYQQEAVNQGLAIMKRHGGFILADVVGLGKTFTALMIVKRHLLETGFKTPILIICPPAIKQSWSDSIEYFDKNEVSNKKIKPRIILTTIGCLEDANENSEYVAEDDFNETFKKANYSMIVVDESHRFRNNKTIMYQKLDDLIGSIAPQPYVILLSATPQNNKPYDLKNQIYLFQREHNNSTLQNLGKHENKLENYFAEKQRNYEEYIKKDKRINGKKVPKTKEEAAKDKANLIADNEDIRKRIVEPLIIRRTRTDIEKYYNDDMKAQGLCFPKIKDPVAIPYEMKGDLAGLFNNTINIIAPQVSKIEADEDGNPVIDFGTTEGKDGLGYYRYRAIEFLISEENRRQHEVNNLTVEDTSQRLAQLMELHLVKRLESSQAAFKESLHNLRRYTENMINMWNENRIFICPDLDVNKELNDSSIKKNGSFAACLDIIANKAKKANKKKSDSENIGANREYKKNDFDKNYIELLQNDLRLINNLCDQWDKQTDDPKIETFIRKFDSLFFDKAKNPFQKLIVFTECIATQKTLVQKLENCASEFNILSITAENRDLMKDTVAANFDTNYKGKKRDDYQILITTDVLSEGVNLHRSNSILNYDSPWNATRLMQRLGRINRIGTKAEEIWNYNFYPSTLGDNQINLKNRTYIKLQAFHELFGEDSQIYSTEEEIKHFDKVDREEANTAETPIMPFIAELRKFKKQKEAEYNRLAGITQKAISTTHSGTKQFFASLHEMNKNGEGYNSFLFIVNKENETVTKVGQLEFFETLKPLITSEAQSTAIAPAAITACQEAVMECYNKDKQTAALTVRGRKTKHAKEINQARAKIQALYTHVNSEKLRDMLNAISDALIHHNVTVAKQVLKTDFEANALFDNKDSIITALYQLARQNKPATDTHTELSIALITE
ncbi:DEAD/DEAH box helicase family protein [Treponema parvum]|uniref:DEAD/DEAH box helicase family protein n=1 Tax=Treponema parvum TaxID=138851 RepID=A0A975IDP2_9SPIR|nr:helicase-related protein [Treponema parvum]QTQ12419.1 DEAD/DEAH box helicase family protein [Treponema parvum]QTQ15589.1 DEAD/DEAH box helicase family protein [Treponema parvum]